MKKVLLGLSTVLFFFLFLCRVKALTVLKCDDEVTVGENITCSIETDETVYVSSSLEVVAVTGNDYSYNDKVATFNSDGSIIFKAASKGTYKISVKNKNEAYSDHEEVVVKEKVPMTTTTTTTAKLSDNAYLSNIFVDGKEIDDFNKNVTKYYVTVENDVKSVRITADAEDLLANVEINGPDSLEVGDNEFTIGVTSEDNTTKFYKVIITRKEEGKSSDTKLKNIKVKGYDLNFDRDSKTFYLKVDQDVTRLDIEVVTNDKNAKYEIEGNENLTNDSVIRIKVTAENDDTDTYRIIIQKESESSSALIIGVVIALLVIAILVVTIVIKKKNNKNKKSDKKEGHKEVSKESTDMEATKKMPPISPDTNETKTPKIDNDEEEETRFLSYEEQEKLAKNNDLDGEVSSAIDEELEKTITFTNDENEEE